MTPRAPGATCCAPTDTLARDGGEEFALLLAHCGTTTAEAIVARLLDAVPDGQIGLVRVRRMGRDGDG